MALQVEVHSFLEACAYRKALRGGDIIGHRKIQVRAFVPTVEVPHGVDVIGAVGARKLEDFRLAVGELNSGKISLTSRLFQVGELAFNAARTFVVDDCELWVLALEFALAAGRVDSVNAVRGRVDRDGNAAQLDDFERAFSGRNRLRFHARVAPYLHRQVNNNNKTPVNYGGGGGS